MKDNHLPPRWADRFLAWYCNPDLLEEIQGDAHELYYERLRTEGPRAANFKYIWDVIRFCRMSNVRKTDVSEPGFFGIFWNMNMKIAIRNSLRNKTVFAVKLSALAICLAFTFVLAGFVISELGFDHQHKNYKQIYRVGSKVTFQGRTSSYAISALPTAPALAVEVPEVERSTRMMAVNRPSLGVGDLKLFDETTFCADSNFLKIFDYEYIQGSNEALDEPSRMVITESLAKRLFGETHVVGRDIDLGWTKVMVTAVIRDLPLNTHMTFDALLSWETIMRRDEWDNFNAYAYIQVAPEADMNKMAGTITEVVGDYIQQVSEEYQMDYKPIIQRIDRIHLDGYMDEDFAPKRSRSYIYIIVSVAVLFMLTGLFNYLNLALAELTSQLKKIAILRTFGGVGADHRKVALTDSVLCLMIVAPLVVLIMAAVVRFPNFLPAIDPGSWTHPVFLGFVGGLIAVILLCSSLNSIMISGKELVLTSMQGKSTGSPKGLTARKLLAAAQLSFSIVMIGLITVIVDQFRYVNDAEKGFDDHDIIVLTRPGEFTKTVALEESIRKLAGVKQVSGSSFLPGAYIETKDVFQVETDEGVKKVLVNFIACEKDYAEVLNLQLAAGRFFDEEHSTDAGGAYVINEAAAKQFGWDDPIGKSIDWAFSGRVIGVVKDFHFESMHNRIEPLILFLTGEEMGIDFVYIKTEPMQSTSLIHSIEREYRAVFPDLAFDFSYLDSRYQGLYRHDYEIRDIFQWGLVISIVVSALGIFSISALMLSLRTKEMGIRKVVGAANSQLFLMHLKPFVTFLAIGLAIGLPVIFYLSGRWLNNFAYHIELSAWYFLLPGVVTVVIVLVASVYHAVGSAKVNPVDILKSE